MPSLSELVASGLLHPQWGRAKPNLNLSAVAIYYGHEVSEGSSWKFGGKLSEGWSLLHLDASKCSPLQATVTAPHLPTEDSGRPPHGELGPKTWTDSSRILLSLFLLCSYHSSLILQQWFSYQGDLAPSQPSPGIFGNVWRHFWLFQLSGRGGATGIQW